MFPNNPDPKIINGLSSLYFQKKFSKALEDIEKFLKEFPDSNILFNIKATIHKSLGDVVLAEKLYLKSIQLNSQYPQSYNNLGVLYLEQRNFKQAESMFMQAIEIDEKFVEGYSNLGNSFLFQRKLLAAENYYRRAITIDKKFIDGYINLGNCLIRKNNINEAEEILTRALAFDSLSSKLNFNLGVLYEKKKDFNNALMAYKNAFERDKNYLTAKAKYLNLSRIVCNFENQEPQELHFFSEEKKSYDAIEPFSMLAIDKDPACQLDRATNWSRRKYNPYIKSDIFSKKTTKKKIRLGYIGSDFKEHAVGYQIKKLIRLHNRKKIEVYGYSLSNCNSEMSDYFSKAFDKFVDISMLNLDEAHETIKADELDIAIDLNGHTLNQWTEIFASRIAPIQINHVGYPGSMGTCFHDYIVADNFVIPKESEKFYSEKVIYMPDQYQPQDNDMIISSAITNRFQLNLPENGFVFCAMNNSYKISHDVFKIWMKLLLEIENSFLWLLESNKFMKQNILKELEKYGVQKERVIFAGKVPHEEYLARFRLADIYLDTFDYNAGTTASNALYAGLPVITKAGRTFASRMAGSFLKAIDLPELITYSSQDYFQLAVNLATDKKLLSNIKDKLLNNIKTKPLFNSKKYAKDFDKALIKIHDLQSKGKDIESIFI